MNHEQIEQFNLIDRYLMGKLEAEELSGFEEHFIDCPQCTARLQTTNNFLQDLRRVNAEQPLSQGEPPILRSRFWIGLQMLLGKPMAWAAIGVCVVTLVSTFFAIHQAQRLQVEVDQAKSDSAALMRHQEAERQAAALAEQQHQEKESSLIERLHQLEGQAQGRPSPRRDETTASGEGMKPGISLPIFILHSLRGGEPNAVESVNKITLSRSTRPLVLSLLLEDERKYADYRIKIFDPHNHLILEKSGFQPDLNSALSIGFDSSFFRAGKHLLIVEGIKKEGGIAAVGKYPFLILKNS